MIGTLVKISPQKKLMIKISEATYDYITARLIAECKKKGFPTTRLATFTLEDDDGEENHFVMISLDRYDKQSMRKFEQLLKKDVAIQYRMKPYDFIPEGQDEQVCGINLELVSIHQVKAKPSPFVQLMDEVVAERMKLKELQAAQLISQRDMADVESANAEKYGTEKEFSDAQADVKKLDEKISQLPPRASYASATPPHAYDPHPRAAR